MLPTTTRYARSLPYKARAFVAFVCLVLAGLHIWREWTAYEAELSDAEVTSYNLARSLAQHADDTFDVANTALLAIVNQAERDGLGPASIKRLHDLMALDVAEQPRLRGLFVYDQRGYWLASSLSEVDSDLNNADREYFRHHRDSRERGAHLGLPIESRSSGLWVVTLSRRLENPDGSFGGVAVATIDVARFSSFYGNFDVGSKGTIALLSTNGPLLARSPFDMAYFGRDLSASLRQLDLGNAPEGTRRFKSPLDGVARISAYRQAMRFPVLVVVALARDDVLAEWANAATYRFVGISILIALIGTLGFRLANQMRRRSEVEAALAQSETKFRLLAESSSDMVVRVGLNGTRQYVSPSSRSLLGYWPDDLIGRSVLDGVHPDDLGSVEAGIARLRSGELTEAVLCYRVAHASGSWVWIEAAVHVTNDGISGLPDGVVAIARDISERKRLEEQLSLLARTDGLTSLANRRRFDEALALEVRRSMREQRPLSLVLIDVDRFKLFNDTFGHPAGDACLQSVAQALSKIARRPDDLVARFGGEEFVLLLPSTDAVAALMLAERARVAVAELTMRHGENQPWGVVTISAGLSTWTAPEQLKDGEQLLMMADAALYQAKAQGRNRSLAFSSAGT
jgi:diguanylate cyclase (GGDEF)-like protein/PAS domain S-box-containing protein